jgi:hypothetical protein
MNLEQLMEIAYKNTDAPCTVRKITMTSGWAVNMPKYTQAFESLARPYSRRTPRPDPSGGTVISDCVGYKSLTVWVSFGDNTMWAGPKLNWMYQDNSMRCMGPTARGDETNIDELERYAQLMRDEGMRIFEAETAYLREHDTLDGFQMEGYKPA